MLLYLTADGARRHKHALEALHLICQFYYYQSVVHSDLHGTEFQNLQIAWVKIYLCC